MIKARPCAGDIAAGEAFLKELVALHLAQISRLRRGRRRARDEAADGRLQGPRRDRDRRPQHQARARRHPRDRVLRADPAVDRGRPPPRAARPRDAGDARPTSPRAAGSAATPRDDLAEAYRFLRVVEHRLQMVADEQTHTLPAERDGLERFARFLGFAGPRRLRGRAARAHAQGAAPIRAAVRGRARRRGLAPRARRFRRRGRHRETLDKLAAWAFAARSKSARRCAAGSHGEYRSLQERVCARASCRTGAGADRPSGARRKIRTRR